VFLLGPAGGPGRWERADGAQYGKRGGRWRFSCWKDRFFAIYAVIERAMSAVAPASIGSFDDILETDRRTREFIKAEFGF